MRVLALLFVSSLFLPLLCAAADNDNATIRLCAATPVNRSFLNTSAIVARDRLVYYINNTTQKKKAKARVEAIAVESTNLSEAEADSRQKECTYLLTSEFINLDSITPGPAGPTEMPVPIVRNRGTQPRAGLHFRLVRVGSTTNIDAGTLGPAAGSDGDTAALYLLSQLSDRAVHAVLKVRPPRID